MAEPVALQIKTPNALSTLSDIANLAGGIVNARRGGIQLQRETQANQERVNLQGFFSKPENFQTDGEIDLDKVNKAVPSLAPMTGADVIGRLTNVKNLQTQATKSRQELTQDQRALVAGPIGVLGRAGVTDPSRYQAEFENLKATNPDNPSLHRLVESYAGLMAHIPPGDLPKHALVASQQLLTPVAQQGSLTPTASLTPTGGTLAETITQPAVGGNAPSISMTGRAAPLTLPPTTPTVGPTGQPRYLGAPPGGAPGSVPAGNPPGFDPAVAGSAATMNQDWDETIKRGTFASTNIANLQNIKRWAQDAATGVGSDRRSLVAGVAGLVGMDAGEMTKTSTDLLAKNANMLALAGGDTNLARTLAEMANPNSHMTREAINEAANQVISNHKLALAKQQYLRPFKGLNNPDAYNKALSEWNSNADPRLFQWGDMTPRERQEMKSSMTPKEQAEFRAKGVRLQELGILR